MLRQALCEWFGLCEQSGRFLNFGRMYMSIGHKDWHETNTMDTFKLCDLGVSSKLMQYMQQGCASFGITSVPSRFLPGLPTYSWDFVGSFCSILQQVQDGPTLLVDQTKNAYVSTSFGEDQGSSTLALN